MSGLGEFAGSWLREAELGLELSRSRVRLGARVLILIFQIKQSTTALRQVFLPGQCEAGIDTPRPDSKGEILF